MRHFTNIVGIQILALITISDETRGDGNICVIYIIYL